MTVLVQAPRQDTMDSLWSLVDLLSNPKRVTDLLGQLKAASSDLAGEREALEKASNGAKQLAEAAQKLVDANDEAHGIIEGAKRQAKTIVENAMKRDGDIAKQGWQLNEDVKDFIQNKTTFEINKITAEERLAARETAVAKAEGRITNLEAALAKEQKRQEDAATKINAAVKGN